MATRRSKYSGSEPVLKKGIYEARAQRGYKSNGKPNYIYAYGKTKKICSQNLRIKLSEYELGIKNETEFLDDSLSVQIRKYLEFHKKNSVVVSTYSRLLQTLNKDIDTTIGHMLPQDVNTDDIQKTLISLKENNRSYSTIKKCYLLLNAFYKQMLAEGKLKYNPVLAAHLPAKDILQNAKDKENDSYNEDVKYYTEEQVSKIVKEATSFFQNGKPKYRLGWAYVLIIFTGIRRGEALGLKWSKVDDEYIDIENTLVEVDGELISKGPKSKSSKRKIKLCKTAKEALKNLRVTSTCEYVISTSKGKNVRPSEFYRTFASICKGAGLPNYGIHSLRHTFASMLFNNGCELPLISRLLGHSDTKITEKIYVHISQKVKDKPIDSLDSIDLDKYSF